MLFERHGRNMAQDILGNEVSISSSTGILGINQFSSGFLSYETQAIDVIDAAEHDVECVMAQIYAGMIAMFSEGPDAVENADVYIQRVLNLQTKANRRELMNLAMLQAWAKKDVPLVLKIGDELIDEFPTDLVALKLHQEFNFNMGEAAGMLRIAEAGLAANQNNPHIHGMLAFAHEQMHDMRAAETSARRALHIKEKEPWAQHALAHVMLTEGRVPEGISFLNDVSAGWTNLNSFMHTHNWWHMALFKICMGDFAAALAIYDRECWSQDRTSSQDQIGAISLLARIEMAGGNVGSRWAELANYIQCRHSDVEHPFLSMQYIYGLAKAGLAEADQLMISVETRAANAAEFEHVAWCDVAVPACRGLLAHAREQYESSVEYLSAAMPKMMSIGGSHAQRDLFAQVLLDAHIQAGHFETARDMLESRRKYDPNGAPLNRMLAEIYERLGLLDEAKTARARHY